MTRHGAVVAASALACTLALAITAVAVAKPPPAATAPALPEHWLPPPPPEIDRIVLPEGRLTVVSVREGSAAFLDTEHSSRTGDVADVWTYIVTDPPWPTRGKLAVQQMEHISVDCRRSTLHDLGAKAFDEAGEMVIWTPALPPRAIVPHSLYDLISQVMCKGLELPSSNTVQGHAAALQMARRIIPHGAAP
jgi:hypothetical protein